MTNSAYAQAPGAVVNTAGSFTAAAWVKFNSVNANITANFIDLGTGIVISASGQTNYPDNGAATNQVPRFYRIRLML